MSYALVVIILALLTWHQASAFETETVQDQVYKIAPAYGLNPELVLAIRHCESYVGQPLHHNEDGTVDIGELQINERHLPEAKAMGLDLYTTRGNLVFGSWLMSVQGTTPWNASKKCWKKLI